MAESINQILDDESLNITERYITIYRNYLSNDDQNNYSVFKQIIEISNDIDYKETDKEDEIPIVKNTMVRYYSLLRELVVAISRMNLFTEGFYEKLYSSVFRSDVFPQTDAERGIMLYLLALRINGLPYYQAKDPIILEDTEFSDTVKEIENELNKALYMINGRFDSRTEAASQLCDLADSLDSRKKKAVFWACIMSALRQRDNNDD